MDIAFKLEQFEGPLDLLLHLIEKNKVSIYDIPIALITEQYMEYVTAMPKEDLDVMSDFLVMAATLLSIKSRMLIPVEEEEDEDVIDPRTELVERLLAYKTYKLLSSGLRDMYGADDETYYHKEDIPKEVLAYRPPIVLADLMGDLTPLRLGEIYRMVTKRQVDKLDPVRSKFGEIVKEKIKLSDKLVSLFDYARSKKRFSFKQTLSRHRTRTEVVVTFLAMLELMREGIITTSQDEAFGDIDIAYTEGAQLQMSGEELMKLDSEDDAV